jgi:8-oxo-dGTP pyrophosphatase MutT (NUDIX family)
MFKQRFFAIEYFITMNELHNPWTILDAEDRYENNWIKITHFNVLNPSGGKGIYGKVHFKSFAIGIVPLDEDMNIYLVGQYRFPIGQYSWELPEGGGAFDAEPLDSAKRELEEETGLRAVEWTELLRMHLSNSVSDELSIIYMARGLEQHTPMPEETEQLIIKKVPFEEAYNMVEKGTITDSITVAALMKIKILLLDGKLK